MQETSAPSRGAPQPASESAPNKPPTDDRARVSRDVQDTPAVLPDMNVRRDETRRERNRQHARASRERKQLELQTLQVENVRLRNTIVNLEREVADGAKEINDLRKRQVVTFQISRILHRRRAV